MKTLPLAALLLLACNAPSAPSGPTAPASAAASAGAPSSAAAAATTAATSASAVPAARGSADHDPPLPEEDEATAREGQSRAEAAGARLIGQPGPAVVLQTLDHGPLDLGALLGKKPIYLKFWATWCGPCRAQMPGFSAIHEKHGDALQVVAVNAGFSDDAQAVRAYQRRLGLKMPVVIDDGTLADLLSLTVTPQHVLIGRDGRIAYLGHTEGPALDTALAKVLAAPPTAEAVSAPAPAATTALRPGDAVGALSITDISGATVALGAAGPRGVLLFWPWCESYLAESRPKVAKACQRVREQVEANRNRFKWLAVSDRLWTAASDLRDYQAGTHTEIPLALDADGRIFRAFGVREVPAVALIGADGKLVRVLGPEAPDLQAAIDALAAP